MINEGSRIDYLNRKIAQLTSIHKNISNINSLDPRLQSITQKIEKLNREKENWENLYRAVEKPISVNEYDDNKKLSYSGNIDSYNSVNGIYAYDKTSIHHQRGTGSGDRWRYDSSVNNVIWTTTPSKDKVEALNNWLAKKRIFPNRHIFPETRGQQIQQQLSYLPINFRKDESIDASHPFYTKNQSTKKNIYEAKPLLNWYQAILTNNPVKLNFAEIYEDSHLEIIKRLFPKEMEALRNQFINMGYNDEENDASYKAANYIAKIKKLARILMQNDTLYFNTDEHKPLTDNQIRYLKNYCIEHNLKLVWDMGSNVKKEIELNEQTIKLIKRLILERLKEIKDKNYEKHWIEIYKPDFDDKGRVIAYHGTTPNNAKKIKQTGFRERSYFSLKKEYSRHWGIVILKVALPLDSFEVVGGDLVADRFIPWNEVELSPSNIKEIEGYDPEMELRGEVKRLEINLRIKFPQLADLSIFLRSGGEELHLNSIKMKPNEKGKGIGSKVMDEITEFADEKGLYITLKPIPDRGYKAKLHKFYKRFGFYPNKGRYGLSQYGGAFGVYWIRRPKNKKI